MGVKGEGNREFAAVNSEILVRLSGFRYIVFVWTCVMEHTGRSPRPLERAQKGHQGW